LANEIWKIIRRLRRGRVLLVLLNHELQAGSRQYKRLMKVAIGLKAHSGWAALVALWSEGDDVEILDRRRLELVKNSSAEWAKQPFHAAENLESKEAQKLVYEAIKAARAHSTRELRTAVKRLQKAGHKVARGAVLMSEPMPDWTVEQILAVHFRMHKAEGVLFREALAGAVTECGLKLVKIREKELLEKAELVLGESSESLSKRLAAIGRSVGPPWTKDQKDATLAAMIALRSRK